MSAPRTRTARLLWHLLIWKKYTRTIIPDLFPPDIVPPGLPRIVLLLQVPLQVGAAGVHGHAARALELDLFQKARRLPHIVCLTFLKKNPSHFCVRLEVCREATLEYDRCFRPLGSARTCLFWRMHFSSSASIFPLHLFCDFQVKNSSLIALPSPHSNCVHV